MNIYNKTFLSLLIYILFTVTKVATPLESAVLAVLALIYWELREINEKLKEGNELV